MLHIVKDDFDESPEDILKTINKILNNKDDKTVKTEDKNKGKE